MFLSSPYFPVFVINFSLFEAGSLSFLIQVPVLKIYIHNHNPDPYRQTDIPHNSLKASSSSPHPGLTF